MLGSSPLPSGRSAHLPAALVISALLVGLVLVVPLRAADLEPRTAKAFDDYLIKTGADFDRRVKSDAFLWADGDARRRKDLLAGKIVVSAGDGDGILGVPGGLIHHWIGTVFMPGMSIDPVLELQRRYADYPRVHEFVLRAELLERRGDTDRILLRLEQKTRWVHAVLDTWWSEVHHRPAPDRAFIVSRADNIQQVVDFGTPAEHRLPAGHDGGYLWRAQTYTKVLERDGGTYIEFQTLGLSRPFPRLLGWLIEPFVRGVGRSSVGKTLDELRAELTGQPRSS